MMIYLLVNQNLKLNTPPCSTTGHCDLEVKPLVDFPKLNMMKWILLKISAVAAYSLFIAGPAQAQAGPGSGAGFAKEAMALVVYAEMGNIGAQDTECKGTPFPVTNIDTLVRREVVPIIDEIYDNLPNKDPKQRKEMIKDIKQMARLKDGNITIAQKLYTQKKADARIAYGDSGVCPALSVMVQTVLQQRRVALRDIKRNFKSFENK